MENEIFMPRAFVDECKVNPSKFMYHYTNAWGLLGIVERSKLWATDIRYLNDIKEFELIFEIVSDYLKIKIPSKSAIMGVGTFMNIQELFGAAGDDTAPDQDIVDTFNMAWLIEAINRGIDSISSTKLFVTSFCCQDDLLSQWRGYSGGAYGYAVGLVSYKLKNFAEKAGYALGKCTYDKSVQLRIVKEIVDYYLDKCITNVINYVITLDKSKYNNIIESCAISFSICGGFFKDSSFSEEEEWRIVSLLKNDKDGVIRFRPGNSMVIPYSELEIGSGANSAIDHIIVGPCPHIELSKASVATLLSQHMIVAQNGESVRVSSIPYRNW